MYVRDNAPSIASHFLNKDSNIKGGKNIKRLLLVLFEG